MTIEIIFDIIITVLGIYLFFEAYRMKKKKIMPITFLTEEEMKKCNDKDEILHFLFPKVLIFGGISLCYGILTMINDLFFPMNRLVVAIGLFVFVGAWIWFSLELRNAKKKFL